jgi:hypothetical protein
MIETVKKNWFRGLVRSWAEGREHRTGRHALVDRYDPEFARRLLVIAAAEDDLINYAKKKLEK